MEEHICANAKCFFVLAYSSILSNTVVVVEPLFGMIMIITMGPGSRVQVRGSARLTRRLGMNGMDHDRICRGGKTQNDLIGGV